MSRLAIMGKRFCGMANVISNQEAEGSRQEAVSSRQSAVIRMKGSARLVRMINKVGLLDDWIDLLNH
jgi:hypothetical protein